MIDKWCFSFLTIICSVCNLGAEVGESNTFLAGIEVGSKGVKVCVINPSIQSNTNSTKIVYDSTINTDFIKFSIETTSATVNAVVALYNIAAERYHIADKNIYLAISSGVSQTADREQKQSQVMGLADYIRTTLKNPNKGVELINVYQEAVYTHTSVIPLDETMTSIIIDVGSGNTKGGYFITKGLFNTFNVPWGTKSLSNKVEEKCDTPCSVSMYNSTLKKKVDETVELDISQAVDHCGIRNYNFNILLSGGIAWATASLIDPKNNNKSIELTYSDVNKFHIMLSKNYEKLSSDDYKDALQKIGKVYTQKNLISGTRLLLKIMEKFERESIIKTYTFIKNNKAGWLPAYIIDKSSK